jgi:hypothetical protein
MIAQRKVTTTVSRTVFHSNVAVSGRQMRWATRETPAPCASINKNTRGASKTSATKVLEEIRNHGSGV